MGLPRVLYGNFDNMTERTSRILYVGIFIFSFFCSHGQSPSTFVVKSRILVDQVGLDEKQKKLWDNLIYPWTAICWKE